MSERTAVILGATGLVGRQLVDVLLSGTHYEKITLVTRKSFQVDDQRLKVFVLEDFEHLLSLTDHLKAHDYYCTLGTTIKKAGSKKNFIKVDLEYPLLLAQIAKQSPDFSQYLVVTATGANANSLFFYNKIKGQLEGKLKEMGIPALKIFRPSLLLGEREEFRFGEAMAKVMTHVFTFFMVGVKKRLWSIQGAEVATAMYIVARKDRPGLQIFSSNDMVKTVNSQKE